MANVGQDSAMAERESNDDEAAMAQFHIRVKTGGTRTMGNSGSILQNQKYNFLHNVWSLHVGKECYF